MSKNLFALSAVLSAAFFVGCHSEPTVIDSTRHKHEGEKPVSKVLSSKGVTNSAAAADHGGTDHGNTKHDSANQSEANHSGMKSVPNAANQPYDAQFLDTMIAHHDGAIEMAKAANVKANSPELKIFAAKIAADQSSEIGELKKWRDSWYAQTPAAMNMEMAGMADSMKKMDMPKLNAATGKDFDLEFVNQMIPHHEGAIVMAREALTKAEHAEIKTLANQIIKAQETEISQMQNWKTQWTK